MSAATKYLSHYTETQISRLLEKLGAFFAFSQKQFDESAVKGEKYTSLRMGAIVPTRNAAALVDGLGEIVDKGIEADKADHTPEQIILRELRNHECFYTGDDAPAVEQLARYGDGFAAKDIRRVFGEASE